jgi:hypothetical protein
MVLSEPARVGSTRCMVRYTVTDVASFTLAQPVAAAAGDPPADDVAAAAAEADDVAAPDVAAPDDAAGAPAAVEAVTEPHPARAEHSSTASTVPRTWGGDIMLL